MLLVAAKVCLSDRHL